MVFFLAARRRDLDERGVLSFPFVHDDDGDDDGDEMRCTAVSSMALVVVLAVWQHDISLMGTHWDLAASTVEDLARFSP